MEQRLARLLKGLDIFFVMCSVAVHVTGSCPAVIFGLVCLNIRTRCWMVRIFTRLDDSFTLAESCSLYGSCTHGRVSLHSAVSGYNLENGTWLV